MYTKNQGHILSGLKTVWFSIYFKYIFTILHPK